MSIDLEGLSLTPELADLMQRLTGVAARLQRVIARNGISQNLGADQGLGGGGDGQKALDVIADEAFKTALEGSAVVHFASEEDQDFLVFEGARTAGGAGLALAIDPLDGSSNIDVNISIGSIYSVFPAAATPEASFLRSGRDQIAAGFFIYGPQCALIATFGAGVLKWVLDPDTGRFERLADLPALAPDTTEYAINASNQRHWSPAIRAYVSDLVAGAEGPRGRNFNTRWIASLVAETYRILHRGGVFLYPADSRKGYERGRLRQVYECAPISFIIEQAGGAATDGMHAVLDEQPDTLHGRTPFVFGTAAKVVRIAHYHAVPDAAGHVEDADLPPLRPRG